MLLGFALLVGNSIASADDVALKDACEVRHGHRAGDHAQCKLGQVLLHRSGPDVCVKPGSLAEEAPFCRGQAEPVPGPGHDRCVSGR